MEPKARNDNILIQKVGAEVVIYDRERHVAHNLSQPAAFVWQHCDGQTTIGELATLLEEELHHPVDEEFIWLVLDQLQNNWLLREAVKQPGDERRISRRQATKNLGQAALMLVAPIVVSIVVPTPAMAQSSVACGQSVPCGW
jgi:hypothetical protein